MSFDGFENDNQEGQPARAYQFTLGDAAWRYVTSERDLVIGGKTWKAVPISDDGVKLSGDTNSDALTITAPSDIGPALMFRGTPPSRRVGITIFNYHRSENQMHAEYVGEVSQVDQPQPGVATLMCESLFASMQRDGLRLSWQRACPYALYDTRTCRVNKESFGVDAVLATAAHGIVTSNALAAKENGYFSGGMVTWEHPVRGLEFRAIEEHVGDQLKMFGDSDGMYEGLIVRAYPGCNRSATHCRDRFDNWINFGGCPDLDGTNPFDGNPVF